MLVAVVVVVQRDLLYLVELEDRVAVVLEEIIQAFRDQRMEFREQLILAAAVVVVEIALLHPHQQEVMVALV